MHTDFIVAMVMLGSSLIGFILGRIERKDSYAKMYRHGFNIGKAVGKREVI